MWMTYRTDGSPIWYYAHMNQQNGKFRIMPGQALYTGSWVNNAVALISLGTMTFTTSSATSGVISWVLNGVAWQEPIQYYVFDTAGTAPKITGNWYDPNQSGWGVYPSVEYDSMITAYLGYDTNGQSTWVYQSAGGAWNGSAFTATLAKRTGVNLCPGCAGPTSFSSVDVGTMSLHSFDNNPLPMNGKLNLLFQAASGMSQWNRTNLPIYRITY